MFIELVWEITPTVSNGHMGIHPPVLLGKGHTIFHQTSQKYVLFGSYNQRIPSFDVGILMSPRRFSVYHFIFDVRYILGCEKTWCTQNFCIRQPLSNYLCYNLPPNFCHKLPIVQSFFLYFCVFFTNF